MYYTGENVSMIAIFASKEMFYFFTKFNQITLCTFFMYCDQKVKKKRMFEHKSNNICSSMLKNYMQSRIIKNNNKISLN